MNKDEQRDCILCGCRTRGSVGAAGYEWKSICQPCKDSEDEAAANALKRMNKSFDTVFGGKK